MYVKNVEVVQLFRHHHHDLMNHLQVIKGYASMNRPEEVSKNLDALIEHVTQERKLMNLNTPHLFVWALRLNSFHKNIKLTFQIHIENKSLVSIEADMLQQYEKIVHTIENLGEETELYEMHFKLRESSKAFHSDLTIIGLFKDRQQLVIDLNKIGNYIDEKGIEDKQHKLRLDFPK